MKPKIYLLLLSLGLTSCVSSKKYTEAQTEIVKCKSLQQDEKESYERQLPKRKR